MSAPTPWTDALRDRCADRCADFGEPACWRLPELSSDAAGLVILPCEECVAGTQVEPGEPEEGV